MCFMTASSVVDTMPILWMFRLDALPKYVSRIFVLKQQCLPKDYEEKIFTLSLLSKSVYTNEFSIDVSRARLPSPSYS
jgi:hypothetical protein